MIFAVAMLGISVAILAVRWREKVSETIKNFASWNKNPRRAVQEIEKCGRGSRLIGYYCTVTYTFCLKVCPIQSQACTVSLRRPVARVTLVSSVLLWTVSSATPST